MPGSGSLPPLPAGDACCLNLAGPVMQGVGVVLLAKVLRRGCGGGYRDSMYHYGLEIDAARKYLRALPLLSLPLPFPRVSFSSSHHTRAQSSLKRTIEGKCRAVQSVLSDRVRKTVLQVHLCRRHQAKPRSGRGKPNIQSTTSLFFTKKTMNPGAPSVAARTNHP